ncbi:hypothetical protein CYG49_00140 [Candidatus Saccharibacteria bacterium]|nr:MAG: hypothetical protein CYG49_00140 [Candidatus Saccharibacteria bacterium]
MSSNDLEQQLDSEDVFAKIAAIEAEADLKARQEESQIKTPKKKTPITIKPPVHLKKPLAEAPAAEAQTGFKKKHGKKPFIIGVSLVLVGAVIGAWMVPVSRHAALNAAGVRGAVTIVGGDIAPQTDGSKMTIVKNFSVQMNGQTYNSGQADRVTITDQPFGTHKITVTKQGYTPSEREVTVDFHPIMSLAGAAEKQEYSAGLIATGIEIRFTAKDWASNKPIQNGDYTIGDTTARPDKNGLVTLHAPVTDSKTVAVEASFKSGQFANKTVTVALDSAAKDIFFVPAARHFFISKRGNVQSVWSSLADGSEAKEFIRGTDQESQAAQFAVSPSGKYAAFVSTRDGRRDETGALMQKLYWVDLASGAMDEMDSGHDIKLLDWHKDVIVYTLTRKEKGTIKGQLMRSLEMETKNQFEVATTSGEFKTVMNVLGSVVFTQNDTGSKGALLKKAGIKGENATELGTQVEELMQLDANKFAYRSSEGGKWHEFNASTNQAKEAPAPADKGSLFIATPNSRSDRLLLTTVDDKTTLSVQSKDGKKQQLTSQAGITGPIRFLNDTTIAYRVIGDNETADYAVSVRGGEPRKMTDVTATLYTDPPFFRFY